MAKSPYSVKLRAAFRAGNPGNATSFFCSYLFFQLCCKSIINKEKNMRFFVFENPRYSGQQNYYWNQTLFSSYFWKRVRGTSMN